MDRRKFVFGTSLLTAIGVFVRPAWAGQNQSNSRKPEEDDASTLPIISDPGEMRGEMLYRLLDSTGERVSAIGLGGSHIAKPTISATENL